MKIKAVLTAIVLALTVAAGCGGSNDDPRPDTGAAAAAPTKQAFIAKADVVCKKENKRKAREGAAYMQAHAPMTPPRLEKMIATVVLPDVREQARVLAAMEAPEGEEDEVEAVVVALRKAADAVESEPGSALDGARSPFLAANRVSRAYGFQICAQN